MRVNRIEIWFRLSFFLISNLSILRTLAAPQKGQTLDFGIYKISIDTKDGFAIRREINIDTPFFKLNRTNEIGIGSPVIHSTDSDSEEDSSENQSSRRKRELADHISTPNGNLKRRKRSPCFGTYGAQATTAPTDVDAARRRRIAARKALQAARKKKGTRKKSKSSKGRRRRQTETKNSNNEVQLC